MKRGEEKEIVAYRVGEELLCPECYNKNVKILSVHEIELPGKPMKREDIRGFVCGQCKTIKGNYKISSLEELRALQIKLDIPDKLEKEKLGEDKEKLFCLTDEINHCSSKISFICNFLANGHDDETDLFSVKGKFGLHLILRDLEDDLDRINNEIWTILSKKENGNPRSVTKEATSVV